MAAAVAAEPTVLSRVDRLDMMLGYLEELRGASGGRRTVAAVTVRSSCASTTSSSSATSDSVDDSTPKSIGRHCRPLDDAVAETQLKGTLLDRIQNLESRLMMLEEQIEHEKRHIEEDGDPATTPTKKAHHGIGLKRLVKSCVKLKTKE